MTKAQAHAIYKITALPEWELLTEYMAAKLDALHKDLETYGNLDEIARLQGECVAIRAHIAIRDKAQWVLEK